MIWVSPSVPWIEWRVLHWMIWRIWPASKLQPLPQYCSNIWKEDVKYGKDKWGHPKQRLRQHCCQLCLNSHIFVKSEAGPEGRASPTVAVLMPSAASSEDILVVGMVLAMAEGSELAAIVAAMVTDQKHFPGFHCSAGYRCIT